MEDGASHGKTEKQKKNEVGKCGRLTTQLAILPEPARASRCPQPIQSLVWYDTAHSGAGCIAALRIKHAELCSRLFMAQDLTAAGRLLPVDLATVARLVYYSNWWPSGQSDRWAVSGHCPIQTAVAIQGLFSACGTFRVTNCEVGQYVCS